MRDMTLSDSFRHILAHSLKNSNWEGDKNSKYIYGKNTCLMRLFEHFIMILYALFVYVSRNYCI